MKCPWYAGKGTEEQGKSHQAHLGTIFPPASASQLKMLKNWMERLLPIADIKSLENPEYRRAFTLVQWGEIFSGALEGKYPKECLCFLGL